MTSTINDRAKSTISGAGVGLRACHYQAILQNLPPIPWFEALTDNYLVDSDSPPRCYLRAIREHYPIVLHGVGLSIGSTDPLNLAYIKKIQTLIDEINPAFISDHLCWTSVDKKHLHDLLPLPHTQETIKHVTDRIKQITDILQKPFLIENISSYFTFKQNTMPEWEFINTISEKSTCGILLDINNIYVNSFNHGFDPYHYLKQIDKSKVKQFHLAGHTDKKRFLFDNHGGKVQKPVWELYKSTLQRFGAIPTLIEWDENIPSLADLWQEAQKAQELMDQLQAVAKC